MVLYVCKAPVIILGNDSNLANFVCSIFYSTDFANLRYLAEIFVAPFSLGVLLW